VTVCTSHEGDHCSLTWRGMYGLARRSVHASFLPFLPASRQWPTAPKCTTRVFFSKKIIMCGRCADVFAAQGTSVCSLIERTLREVELILMSNPGGKSPQSLDSGLNPGCQIASSILSPLGYTERHTVGGHDLPRERLCDTVGEITRCDRLYEG